MDSSEIFDLRYARACQVVKASICALQGNDVSVTEPPAPYLVDDGEEEPYHQQQHKAANNVRARLHRARQMYNLESHNKLWMKYSPAVRHALPSNADVRTSTSTTSRATVVPPMRSNSVMTSATATKVHKTTLKQLLKQHPHSTPLRLLYEYVKLHEAVHSGKLPKPEPILADFSETTLTIPESQLMCDVLTSCEFVTGLNLRGQECFINPACVRALEDLVTKNRNIVILDITGAGMTTSKVKHISDIVVASAQKAEKKVLQDVIKRQHAHESAMMLYERASKFEITTKEEQLRRKYIQEQLEEHKVLMDKEWEEYVRVTRKVAKRERRQQQEEERLAVLSYEDDARVALNLAIMERLIALCETAEGSIRIMWLDVASKASDVLDREKSEDWKSTRARESVRLELELRECQRVEAEESEGRNRIFDQWSAPITEMSTMEVIHRKDTAKREQAKTAFGGREAKARRMVEVECAHEFRIMENALHNIIVEIRTRDNQQRLQFETDEETVRYSILDDEKKYNRTLRDIYECIQSLLVHENTCVKIEEMRAALCAIQPTLQLGRTSDAPPLVLLVPSLHPVAVTEGLRVSSSLSVAWGRDFDALKTKEQDNNRRRDEILKKRSFLGPDFQLKMYPPLQEVLSAKVKKEEIQRGTVTVECAEGQGGLLVHETHCPEPSSSFTVSYQAEPLQKFSFDDVVALLSGTLYFNDDVKLAPGEVSTTVSVNIIISTQFMDPLMKDEALLQRLPYVTSTLPIEITCAQSYLQLKPSVLVEPIMFNHKMGLTLCRPLSHLTVWNPVPETKLADFHNSTVEIEVVEGFTSFDFLLFYSSNPHGSGPLHLEQTRVTSPEGNFFQFTVEGSPMRYTNQVNRDIYKTHEMSPKYKFTIAASGGEGDRVMLMQQLLNMVCFSNLSVDPVPGPRKLRVTLTDAAKRVSTVDVEVNVEIKDDPTEVIIPFTSLRYHVPTHQYVIPTFLEHHSLPQYSLLQLYQNCEVKDEDTVHFAAGYFTLAITGAAESEDKLEICLEPRCTMTDDEKIFLFDGRVIASVEWGDETHHSLRISFATDGEATIDSVQSLLRCFWFSSKSNVIRDRVITGVIRFGPSARKQRLDGSDIEVTPDMLLEENFTSDPVVLSTTIVFAPCAFNIAHEYTMIKYVEGTGLHRLAPSIDVDGNLPWHRGAWIEFEVVEHRDDKDWLTIRNDGTFDIVATANTKLVSAAVAHGVPESNDIVFEEELDVLPAHSPPRSRRNSYLITPMATGEYALEDPKCTLEGSTTVVQLAETGDSIGTLHIHHPAKLRFEVLNYPEGSSSGSSATLGNAPLTTVAARYIRDLLQTIAYGSTNPNPGPYIKLVKVTASTSLTSNTSIGFFEIKTQPVDNVTQILLKHEVITWRPAKDESIPQVLFPIGSAALVDPDTVFFDGGHLTVDITGMSFKGDVLFFMSVEQQREAIRKYMEIHKDDDHDDARFTEDDVVTITNESAIARVSDGVVLAQIEGVDVKRKSPSSSNNNVLANYMASPRTDSFQQVPQLIIPRLQSVAGEKKGSVGGTTPKGGNILTPADFPLSNNNSPSNSNVYIRFSFPAKEKPFVKLRVLQYLLHCVAFTTSSDQYVPRDVRVRVGDGNNPIDGMKTIQLHVKQSLIYWNNPPRVQLLANQPPRSIFPQGALIGLTETEYLSQGSITITITEGGDDATDVLAVCKLEGGPKIDLRQGAVSVQGALVAHITQGGSPLEVQLSIPGHTSTTTTKPAMKQHLLSVLKSIGIRASSTIPNSTKKIVVKSEMSGTPARYNELSFDVRVL